MSTHLSFESRIYRTALYLYPPRFRQEFGEEMAQDFDDASLEALITDRSRVAFRVRICADLARTIVARWADTGLPSIAIAAAIVPLLAAAGLAQLSSQAALGPPASTDEADLITLALVVMVVLLIVVTTLFFTVWFAHPGVRRRGR